MKAINSFKYIIITIIFLFFIQENGIAQQTKNKSIGLTWYTNLNEAYVISKKTKKPIFGFFTGSDWCGWCHKLQANVFAKSEFITWANKNVVLVELDFPRYKELPVELKNQNESLQQVFQVQGYPTCWMFNLTEDKKTLQYNIESIGSVGYPQNAVPGQEQLKFIADANATLGIIDKVVVAKPPVKKNITTAKKGVKKKK